MSTSHTEPDPDVGVEAVRSARRLLTDHIGPTPLVTSRLLSDRVGCRLSLKCENLQKTGSFKVRGALHFLLQADEGVRERGVVTVSAGNHACATAWAAAQVGLPCTVVMPETAPEAKIAASRDYGARIELRADGRTAFARALELAEREGMEFLHPFDHPWVVAGQGTCALEILDDLPSPDAVLVPVGGGGLIAGVVAALGASRPEIAVYGVEPVGAAVMRESLEVGRPIRDHRPHTVADGLAAPWAGDLTYRLVARHVRDVVTVTDQEIGGAMEWILTRTKLLVEPAGAAAVAALLSGALRFGPKARVVAILSGGNTDLTRIPPLIGKECDPCPVRVGTPGASGPGGTEP